MYTKDDVAANFFLEIISLLGRGFATTAPLV